MKRRFLAGDLIWLLGLGLVTLFFALPATHQTFVQLTAAHPFWMGFIKFAILASMGELLALRLAKQVWRAPAGMPARVFVWGLIGVAVTFMFAFYSAGVSVMIQKGILPTASGRLAAFLQAFFTSLIMNLTFGPVFMAAHRISDTYIEMRARGEKPSGSQVLRGIDWPGFLSFVVGRTIPLWWIPVHTATFLLPNEYRVLAAAYLSIILGIILAYARGKKPAAQTS